MSQAIATPKEKTVTVELNKIDSSICILQERIDETMKRLNPIMHGYEEPEPELANGAKQVQMAQQLSVFDYKLSLMINKINYILNSLEI